MTDQTTPTGRARGILFKLTVACGVLALSSALALLAAELAVRIAAPQQLIQDRPELYQAADSVGYLHRPDVSVPVNTGERTVTVRTDRNGFRIGNAGRKEASTQVLLMGDSFIEALQVEHEQSTSHLLETELQARLGHPVAVRNAGLSGWGPDQYATRTRALLAQDRYALLIVAFFVGNDAVLRRVPYTPARNPEENPTFRLPRRLAAGEFVDAFLAPLNDVLEARSHLFVLVKTELSVLRMKLGLTAEYFPREYLRSEAGSPRWSTTAAIASEIRDDAARRGVPTLFVLVPEAFQVHTEDFLAYVRGFGVDSASADLEQPSRRLFAAIQAAGVDVIDALDPFRAEAATSERLFGRIDHHLSPEGNAMLARLLAPEAQRLLTTRVGDRSGSSPSSGGRRQAPHR